MSDGAWVGSWRPHRPPRPHRRPLQQPRAQVRAPHRCRLSSARPLPQPRPRLQFRGAGGGAAGRALSPGPVYLLPPGTTAKGKDGTPRLLHLRPPPPTWRPSAPPGQRPPCSPSGCYSPERAGGLAFPSAPACTLGSRTRHSTVHQTPGPAAYRLPPMLGPNVVNKSSAPNFSIPGRSNIGAFYEDLCKTPGPCSYRVVDADVYKRRAPQYSMLARNTPPGDPTTKPGPGAYSLQQDRRRGLTFGIRHSDYLAPLIVDVPD
ncbi:unnamed protein product [Bubo scandiacus]